MRRRLHDASYSASGHLETVEAEHAILVEIVSKLVARLPPNEVIELLGLDDRCEPV
jgi:hypothetical protein